MNFSQHLCMTLAHTFWQCLLIVALADVFSRLRVISTDAKYVIHVVALIACLLTFPASFHFLSSNVATPFSSTLTDSFVRTDSHSSRPVMRSSAASLKSENQTTSDTDLLSSKSQWFPITSWIGWSYILGTTGMFARLIGSIARSERLRWRAAIEREGNALHFARTLAMEWKLRDVPLVAQTEELIVPAVVGLLRPTILIPATLLTGLSEGELRLILAHEIAHIHRRDLIVNFLQRIAECVLFFNPAVWYLSRRLDLFREYCCDDKVCRLGGESSRSTSSREHYASALVRVAELAYRSNPAAAKITMLAVTGSHPTELRRRIMRVLNEPMPTRLRASREMAIFLMAGVITVAVSPILWKLHAGGQEGVGRNNSTEVEQTTTSEDDISPLPRVEVVALGTHDVDPQQWWDVEGLFISTVDFEWSENGHVSSFQKKCRRVVVRISDLPADREVTWDIVGAWGYAGGSVTFPGHEKKDKYLSRYFYTPEDQKTIDLRIGIAKNHWRTEHIIDVEGTAGFGGPRNLVSSGAMQTSSATVIVVSHDYFDQNFRIIAIDKQGKTHDTAGRGGTSAGGIYQSRAAFPGLPLGEIDHFEFQTRDYQWIDLKDLPLDPNPPPAK